MTDHDPDEIFAKYGIDVRLAGGPDNPVQIEAALTSAGEQAQAELLHELSSMIAMIAMIAVAVRDNPSDDRLFDLLDQALGQRLLDAKAAIIRLRERRECKGAA